MHDTNLVRLARNCRVPGDLADDLVACCAAVLASSAEDSLIVDVTAARLHRTWLPTQVDQRIHVATAVPDALGRTMTRTRRPEIVAHRRQIPAEDRCFVDGVATLTPARTWRDLAALLPLPDVVAAGDCVLRDGVPRAALEAVVNRTSRLRGGRRAREALELLDPRSRSRGESHLRVAVTGDGMPRFEVNEPVWRAEGGWLAEPDLSLAEARLALEYQGAEHAKLKRMRKDLTRGVDTRSEQWETLAYGPAEVFGRPWQINAEVRRKVKERAPHLLAPRRSHRRSA